LFLLEIQQGDRSVVVELDQRVITALPRCVRLAIGQNVIMGAQVNSLGIEVGNGVVSGQVLEVKLVGAGTPPS
jgi:hypothetical protein